MVHMGGDMAGVRSILRLLWEIIWPYEIRWGSEQKTRRDGPAQLLEFPKEGTESLTTAQPNPPAVTTGRYKTTGSS